MSNNKTRSSLKSEILQYILKLLENNQSIPLTNKTTNIAGVGEVADSMLIKEENGYVLYEISGNDYIGKKMKKEKVYALIREPLHIMNKKSLEEELTYWKDYAEFFEEIEEENAMYFS